MSSSEAPAQAPTPWWRRLDFVLPVAAFALSLMSFYRDHANDVNARRDALHAVIRQYEDAVTQSLDVNRTQNVALLDLGFDFAAEEAPQVRGADVLANPKKIKLILDSLHQYNDSLAAQTMTLAKQALAFVGELGDKASGVDEANTAALLYAARVPDLAETLYQRALDRADNSVEYIAAARGLAQAYFIDGRKAESSAAMTLALDAYDRFSEEPHSEQNRRRARYQTAVWAVGVYGTDDCDLSRSYFAKAQAELHGVDDPAGALAKSLAALAASLPKCFAPKDVSEVP